MDLNAKASEPPLSGGESALAQQDLADLRAAESRALRALRRWAWVQAVCVVAVGLYAVYEIGLGGLLLAALAGVFAIAPLFFAWIPYDQARLARTLYERDLEDKLSPRGDPVGGADPSPRPALDPSDEEDH